MLKTKSLRRIGVIGAVLVALGAASGPAFAQEKYPARPIEIILPVPPGGGTDIAVRTLVDILEPMLGQKIVPVNRPGAGGVLGMTAIVQSKPDGYTLGAVWNAPLTMAPHTQAVPYTPQDYVTIALMTSAPLIMCARPDFPANSGKELLDELRRSPNKYTFGTDGVGATVQLSMERIFQKVGARARAVPFGGAGETLKNFLGGHIDLYGGAVSTIVPHVKAGAAKCLLLTSKDKSDALPQTTSLAELGIPEVATAVWHSVIGPKGIPPDRAAVLEKAFVQAIKSEKFRQPMAARGATAEGMTGAELRKLIEVEYKAMGEITAALGMTRK